MSRYAVLRSDRQEPVSGIKQSREKRSEDVVTLEVATMRRKRVQTQAVHLLSLVASTTSMPVELTTDSDRASIS